jgi:hypothetical protein
MWTRVDSLVAAGLGLIGVTIALVLPVAVPAYAGAVVIAAAVALEKSAGKRES